MSDPIHNSGNDYLWDPRVVPDPEIVALEAHLQSLSSRTLRLDERRVALTARRSHRLRWWVGIAASLAIAFVGSALLFRHRLEWPTSVPWTASVRTAAGKTRIERLEVGSALESRSDETVTLDVARIGTVVVAPDSAIHLIETRTGRHRLQLERGRLHAKIWAPPGYFGVTNGDDVAVDLGCEFDIATATTGRGSLTVTSGWVMYVRGATETLVPEGYLMSFDRESTSTPVRANADRSFRDLTTLLDAQFSEPAPDPTQIDALAARVAVAATQADTFTLLSLLSRHPELARTPLYPRLASALDAPFDELHRSRWARNDTDAKNQWWSRLPKQPKRWWLNWPDAL